MATENITFTAELAAGLQTLVTVKRFPDGPKHQLTFAAGPHVIPLETNSTYVVVADVVGKVGDTLTLSWRRATGGSKPLLPGFKIDPLHVDARPWPSGKWSDRGVTGFEL
jgi:hypothetical protein